MAIQSRKEPFITYARKLIEAHMKEESFGVSELAGKMNMSRSSLHRWIKHETGITVSQYIKNARLNKAHELLEDDFMTVAEAAYMTGFRSASYFSRCFRKHFGYPPVETKKRRIEITDDEDRKLLHNFPVQTTSFIGREKEIVTLVSLVKKYRVVTLSGTGGCGKTRLACETAEHLAGNFPDGICFVDLAPVQTGELVAKQLLTALGLSETPGRERLDTVVESIRDKKFLILLDNCEHLIRSCTEVAHRLTKSAPELSLLITSREALNINGEKVWVVPSLSLPDSSVSLNAAEAEKSEAVNLFFVSGTNYSKFTIDI